MNNEYVVNTMLDYFQLVGKTAIVTGAANGIGAGIAKMLAGLGANVVACDIEDEPLANVVAEIQAAGGSITGIHCDITNMDDIEKAIKTAQDNYGGLEILVNNAAGCGGGKKIDDMTDKEWDRLININLTCVYKTIMKVHPIFRAQKYGKIVNISSGAAITGDWSDPHYAAAKGGVISLGRELAVEFSKDHIYINTVAPGLVQTRMVLPWEGVEENNILVGRIGTPKDIASTVAFLVSSASDYFTGQTICPNGGSWMY